MKKQYPMKNNCQSKRLPVFVGIVKGGSTPQWNLSEKNSVFKSGLMTIKIQSFLTLRQIMDGRLVRTVSAHAGG